MPDVRPGLPREVAERRSGRVDGPDPGQADLAPQFGAMRARQRPLLAPQLHPTRPDRVPVPVEPAPFGAASVGAISLGSRSGAAGVRSRGSGLVGVGTGSRGSGPVGVGSIRARTIGAGS